MVSERNTRHILASLSLIDQITEELDNNKCSLGLFIDLSKAFDSINHKILGLFVKLQLHGIHGNTVDWPTG